ncbi:MAG: response regulator transcription factor [Phycisphaerae bacterium]
MSLARIVIVEDEAPIRQGIRDVLRAAGYDTIESADGEAGLAAAQRPDVDLVLLDLMLPGMDGTTVLSRLRETHPERPVIFLTARGGEDDRVEGLLSGADDYMVKPFSARELVARVQAVLRRSPGRPTDVRLLKLGPITVDFERREVVANDGRSQSLSEMEWGILRHLATHADRAISRDELLTRVWGISGHGVETRTIDMHVARLRSKLAELSGGAADDPIVTVRGKGYMLGTGARPEPGGSSK